jgi:16S rRNA (guanine(966)-N(2))-methyltransferase RsmD
MRILAGQFKGKRLSASSDLSIRPITNRLKEIIFSVIQEFVHKKKILDLFSGSGSLGIEALSRGAGHITFVEKEESSLKVLKNNLNSLNVDQNLTKIIKSDALSFLENDQSEYEIIFSDPPFKYPLLQKLVNQVFLKNNLHSHGLLIVHHEIDNPLQSENVVYTILKQKKIGRSLLSFISKEASDV